ncbi:unnamed protein product [Clavelina lepadiformis]|uniref:Fibrinogen C-terminal domain-containing protein n=1 Tax=Clavelina lepadiformis TaxID=159417 RepID=A0ABP0GEF3_CLALP
MKICSKRAMKGWILFVTLLACYVTITYSQQCRQVVTTVCDDDATFTWTRKLDKSELKCPGADGTIGPGQNKNRTELCAQGSLGTDIAIRLANIEQLLTNPSSTTTTVINLARTKSSRVDSCAMTSRNGVYTLTNGIQVFCENKWTVFQRRIDGRVDFERDWNDYKTGFGQIDGEFWLGLDNIHKLTCSEKCKLRVELWDFEGNRTYANYRLFSIDPPLYLYRLRVAGYQGNAGDSLEYHYGQPFSTWDNDNDSFYRNCATYYGKKQGWWFKDCTRSSLNGVWMRQSTGTYHGIIWESWKGAAEPLKSTKMKFRCD